MKLTLTPEQWVDLLSKQGRWLPMCCASVSGARDVLARVLREGGEIDANDADEVVREVGRHDVIHHAFDGTSPDPGEPRWSVEEGSPWPEIAAACKALLR